MFKTALLVLLPLGLWSASVVMGGGCFWCMEAIFETQEGVLDVTSGYAGGTTLNPHYDDVKKGHTGHAEVIKITYDPQKISLSTLLTLFYQAHDPTTRYRQGHDQGSQYRSILFYQSPDEKTLMEYTQKQAQKQFSQPIVTTIEPLQTFYPAEEFHQNFFAKHQDHPYCETIIAPKLHKIRARQHHPFPSF